MYKEERFQQTNHFCCKSGYLVDNVPAGALFRRSQIQRSGNTHGDEKNQRFHGSEGANQKLITNVSEALPKKPLQSTPSSSSSSLRKETGRASFIKLTKNESSTQIDSSENARPAVQFTHITIHEHDMIIGDNPACSSGCPISMGWLKLTETSLSIDEYEETRPPRREKEQFLIPKDVRHDMLTNNWAFSYRSLHTAISDVNKEREKRMKSQRDFQARMRFREDFGKITSKFLCRGPNLDHC